LVKCLEIGGYLGKVRSLMVKGQGLKVNFAEFIFNP